MPIPKPRSGEEQSDFISRCMSNDTMKEDYPDGDQRLAVCFSSWRDEHGGEAPKARHLAPVYEMKAVPDPATGTFEGYASVFGVVDLFGEKVMPGAFIDSLVDRKRKGTSVKMFWSHDPREPIGRWLDMAEDSKGLYAKGQLNLKVQRALEVHSLMMDGSVDGLSIGYMEQEADYDGQTRLLKKLNLLEVSVVAMPANPRATVEDVKSHRGVDLRLIQFGAAVKAGRPPPVKDFEDILREAGVPKSMATTIASVGYAKAIRSESESRGEALRELRESILGFRAD